MKENNGEGGANAIRNGEVRQPTITLFNGRKATRKKVHWFDYKGQVP